MNQPTPPELFELLIEAEEEADFCIQTANYWYQRAAYWNRRREYLRRMLWPLEQAENVAAACWALQETEE